ncbi:MAG: BatA and WFA domain-containing protein [Bacteroidota bacterium]|nr:BatA and WFA domain-containing protein [Bacteroidota bacterium]
MTWLYPSFLWALLLLAIPIVIHLFNFRKYKLVQFSNVRFLKQIDTQTKSGNQLKKILILCCRLAALSFLIFAFAQPMLKKNDVLKTQNFVSILIDNSYSMNQTGEEGVLLEAAKNRARIIVSQSSNQDRFQIITSNQDPEYLHFQNKEETLEQIDKIKITKDVFPLSQLLETQNRYLQKNNGNKISYVISDFQKTSHQIAKRHIDSAVSMNFVKINSGLLNNFSIDTCYLSSPIIQKGQNIGLWVQVSNFTESLSENITVELMVNNKPKGILNFDIQAFSSEKKLLNFVVEDGGTHKCELKLIGDDMPLDDQLYFTLNLKSDYNILSIVNNNDKNFSALFLNNPGFVYKSIQKGNINYQDFDPNSLIILNDIDQISSGMISEIKKYLSKGGNVFVFPSTNSNAGGLKTLGENFGFKVSENPVVLPSINVNQIELEHPLFKSVFDKKTINPDYPSIKKTYQINYNQGTTVMKLANGYAFLQDLLFKNGHLYICSSPLDFAFSNFQNHALFVPIMIQSAINHQQQLSLYHPIGQFNPIATKLPYSFNKNLELNSINGVSIPEFINQNGELFIGESSNILSAGHYQLKQQNNDSVYLNLSFNNSRSESDPRIIESSKLEEVSEKLNIQLFNENVQKFETKLNQIKKGSDLWKWCVIFVLLFLLIEILLIRYYKPNAKLSA